MKDSVSYWWVNHNRTYKNETEGGYIWSPKENSSGARNQTYLNLALTKLGDIVFSYSGGYVRAIGVVVGSFGEQSKPSDFGKPGDRWAKIGWIVPVEWKFLSVPLVPKNFIEKIAPLLPQKNSPLQKNGNGNQSCYLASIQEDLGLFLLEEVNRQNAGAICLIEKDVEGIRDLEIVDQIRGADIESTEKEQIIRARLGQGRFRQNVERIEGRCRVTGVGDKIMLIASHIKPWRLSSNPERLDGNNGLLLSPHVDKLFDQGWISFSDTGDLICSSERVLTVLRQWGIELPLNVGAFNKKQIEYLEFHRVNIYRAHP